MAAKGVSVPLTPSQRRGLTTLLAAIILILSIRLISNPKKVPDPQPSEGPNAHEVADRLDPNTATEAELAEIPTLGEKRAAAIVEFRQQYVTHHPTHPAFRSPADLQQIPGIGPATIETMEPYLVFHDSSAKQP